MIGVLIMAVLLPMLMAAAFLLGRHLQRRQVLGDHLSAVTRQHIDLFQGGQLNEAQVEAAKSRFRDLLERGEASTVEASLRPGMQYVVQVRALAEIGTDEAGRILERQLHRRLTDDQIEQSWYWIDLASSLRGLNREESLPHLLSCAETAGDAPLGHFFAAETICFLGFSSYLRQFDRALGQAALRVLHRAMEGLRFGVQPYVVMEARLGEIIENLWDHRPDGVHPLVVRVLAEALRLMRRARQIRKALAIEMAEQETFDWQMSRLGALEGIINEYLDEAPRQLMAILAHSPPARQKDILLALDDLRAETAPVVLPLLARGRYPHAELAVDTLLWSRDPRVGPWLREWVRKNLSQQRRSQWRPRPMAPRRASVPTRLPYRAVLRALRSHASQETEAFLLLAARDWDPTYRGIAVGSLGWWEPLRRAEVLACLQCTRRDPCPDVRQAARAALARLGERQALQWFRQALTGEDSQRVHEALQVVAGESLTLLWPDLDRLTDADDPEVAHHAREAIARMSEEMDHGMAK